MLRERKLNAAGKRNISNLESPVARSLSSEIFSVSLEHDLRVTGFSMDNFILGLGEIGFDTIIAAEAKRSQAGETVDPQYIPEIQNRLSENLSVSQQRHKKELDHLALGKAKLREKRDVIEDAIANQTISRDEGAVLLKKYERSLKQINRDLIFVESKRINVENRISARAPFSSF